MQYLLNEVQMKTAPQSGEAKVFKSVTDVIKYLTKLTKNQRIMMNDGEATETKLNAALAGRLSTVSISAEGDDARHWTITAF